jgi:uncharacterized membrane protein (DUF485 family)
MSQPSARPPGHDHDLATRASPLGLALFAFYTLIYAAFVVIAAFAPDLMARKVFGGVNLAIVYGMALIGIAVLLAVVYAFLRGDD